MAYLRDLLPRLASSVSVSYERPLKVNLAQWSCPYYRRRYAWNMVGEREWSHEDLNSLTRSWPPGCEVVVEYRIWE